MFFRLGCRTIISHASLKIPPALASPLLTRIAPRLLDAVREERQAHGTPCGEAVRPSGLKRDASPEPGGFVLPRATQGTELALTVRIDSLLSWYT